LNVMRETLLNMGNAKDLQRFEGESLTVVERFSQKVMTVKKIEQSCSLINDAAYHLERNGSAKMIFLDLSIRLGQVMKPN